MNPRPAQQGEGGNRAHFGGAFRGSRFVCDQVTESYHMLIELNVIFAKAELGYKMKASTPVLNDKGKIKLREARHPLIDPQKVVPTDIELGIAFDTLVITGPNTGGKTVSLKTLGLLTLMAMCGLMIPARDNSELSVFGTVLADIGGRAEH